MENMRPNKTREKSEINLDTAGKTPAKKMIYVG